jgi:glycosyltransferase involved in cell wall biosynthesis
VSVVVKKTIYQCAREVAPGGGVSGVAYFLYKELALLGVTSKKFTIEDLGLSRSGPKSSSLVKKKIVHLFDVVLFSLLGTLMARWKCQHDVLISHNDAVYGDIYVNHGLHRAMIDASGNKWMMLLRNPIHVFLLLREWVRFNFNIHRHIVCFSKQEARQLVSYYPRAEGSITIIPNGVNLDRFNVNEKERCSVRHEAGVGEDDFILIFVGHEYERKGLYLIIEALATLSLRCRLWVIGGTQDEIGKALDCAARYKVEDRIKFWGVRQDVDRLMRAADLLLLASTFEAWPLVGLEAMACGLPVLMTPVGGVSDFLAPGDNGLFIERNADSIACQVSKIANDPDLYRKLSDGAVKTANGYSWASVAARYLELAQKC